MGARSGYPGKLQRNQRDPNLRYEYLVVGPATDAGESSSRIRRSGESFLTMCRPRQRSQELQEGGNPSRAALVRQVERGDGRGCLIRID